MTEKNNFNEHIINTPNTAVRFKNLSKGWGKDANIKNIELKIKEFKEKWKDAVVEFVYLENAAMTYEFGFHVKSNNSNDDITKLHKDFFSWVVKETITFFENSESSIFNEIARYFKRDGERGFPVVGTTIEGSLMAEMTVDKNYGVELDGVEMFENSNIYMVSVRYSKVVNKDKELSRRIRDHYLDENTFYQAMIEAVLFIMTQPYYEASYNMLLIKEDIPKNKEITYKFNTIAFSPHIVRFYDYDRIDYIKVDGSKYLMKSSHTDLIFDDEQKITIDWREPGLDILDKIFKECKKRE